MTGLWFAHPEWLAGVGAVLALSAVGLLLAVLRSQRRIGLLLGPAARRGASRGGADAVLWLALLGVGLALLGPRLGQRSVWMSATGADVVIALDVSRSMDARDVAPSRLDRARRTAAEILERLAPESRAALVAFAGHGVLLTPLTPDTAALVEMLPAVDTRLIRPTGSNLRAGVVAGIDAFEEASRRPRVLVVLSDGEVHVRPAEVGQVEARRSDVRVVAAAFGDPLGATVPDRGAPLRDGGGRIVVSRRETRSLERLADASDGRLWLSDTWGEVDVAALVREIERDTRPIEGEFVERQITAPLIWPFAVGAFALLWLEWVWRPAKRIGRLRATGIRLPRGWRAAALASLVGGLGAGHAEDTSTGDPRATIRRLESIARERTLDPTELLALGVARGEADQLAAAEHAFRQAAASAVDRKQAAAAFHNLGVAALGRRDYAAARDRFFQALEEHPAQHRSRFNLEWTLSALARRAPEEAPPSPQPPEPESEPDRDDMQTEPEPEIPDEPGAEPPEREPSEGSALGPSPAGDESGRAADAREPLDPEARERLLQSVGDDAGPALRALADEARRSSRREEAPAW